MKIEKVIFEEFSRYLEKHGYMVNERNIEDLVDTYMDCQEWIDDNMITGITKVEMLDWIKHTKEVIYISSYNEMLHKMKECICLYSRITTQIRNSEYYEYTIDIA